MKKIVFFDVQDYEIEFLKSACREKFKFELVKEPLNDLSVLTEGRKDAEIISCFTTSRVTKTVLERFNNLKLIALRSVGFNHIDTDFFFFFGI